MAENKYTVEYAKTGRSKCKDTKCKKAIEAHTVRVGKVTKNPFGGGDDSEESAASMTHWYHMSCIFETLKRARKTTKRIESEDDLEGFGDLKAADQETLRRLLAAVDKDEEKDKDKKKGTKRKSPETKTEKKPEKKGSGEKKARGKKEDEEVEAEDMDVYLVADSSAKTGQKFWAIKVEGTEVTTSYGKVGGKATVKDKTMENAEKATKLAKREIKKKEGKGYEVAERPDGDGDDDDDGEKKAKKSKTKTDGKESKEKGKKDNKKEKKRSRRR